jgi:hypothetical protein
MLSLNSWYEASAVEEWADRRTSQNRCQTSRHPRKKTCLEQGVGIDEKRPLLLPKLNCRVAIDD